MQEVFTKEQLTKPDEIHQQGRHKQSGIGG